MFIRACSLERFPTKKEAIEHTREQATAAGATLGDTTPSVAQTTTSHGAEVWLVKFEPPSKKHRPRKNAARRERGRRSHD